MRRHAIVLAGLAGAALLAGCGTAAAPGSTGGSGARAPEATPSTSPSPLPSPFRIVARWTGAALGLNYPRAMALGPDGNIYVTDDHERVSVISPAGAVLRRWGGHGSGPGQFIFSPWDDPFDMHGRIAVAPSGLVYMTDSGNSRVQEFTPQGRFVRQFTGILSSPDYFSVDGAGNVYIADDEVDGVMKYTAEGQLVWRVGDDLSNPDLKPGDGLIPNGFDAQGRLLVTNADRGTILYLDPNNGHEVDSVSIHFDLEGGPCGARVDPSGHVYTTACGPHGGTYGFSGSPGCDTLVFDRSHNLVADWPGVPDQALVTVPYFAPSGKIYGLAWDSSLLELQLAFPRA